MPSRNRRSTPGKGKRLQHFPEGDRKNKNPKLNRQHPKPPINQSVNVLVASEFPLEKLPPQILHLVFQYVQTPDLLKLCYISRTLYPPAAAIIYNTICIGKMHEMYKLKMDRDIWMANKGTFINGEDNVKRLSKAITDNLELRSLVKVVNCVYYSSNLTKHLLSKLTHLQAFYSYGGHKVPAQSARKLQIVRSLSYTMPKFTSNIVELEIVDPNDEKFSWFYGKIGRYMIELESFVNLRKLNFTFERRPQFFAHPLSSDDLADHPVDWLEFFDEFIKAGVKLKLWELGVLGNLAGLVEEATQTLCQAVDLGALKKLHLEHSEYSEMPTNEPTFLEAVTKYTPLLRSLAVFKARHDMVRHVKSISEALMKNIPNQLEDLLILHFPTHEIVLREFVQSVILISQTNLVRLKISTGFEEHAEIFDRYCDIGHSISNDWCVEANKQLAAPRVLGDLHFRPRITGKHIDAIKDKRIQIQRFFEKDLIYKSAAFLPRLTQYYCELVFVDPQRRAVYLNDEMVPLDANIETDDPARRKEINKSRKQRGEFFLRLPDEFLE